MNCALNIMYLNLVKSKIHRVTITESCLDYIGSITIDQDLMEAANIYPNERVQVVDNNNGSRFETYVIPGERGSGVICVNGAVGGTSRKSMYHIQRNEEE